MRWKKAYGGWSEKRLTQEEAAMLLGVCSRTFRRYIDRYEEEGLSGLMDRRMEQVSHHKAPVDEVLALEALYKERYDGWSVQHFFERYREHHAGERSYNWVRKSLQAQGAIKAKKSRGKHRRKRERAPIPGMMIHQDGSTHEWVPGEYWDLIVTMDDANSEIYSGFFVEEEGTFSSLRGVKETLRKRGLFSSFYSDRGSHYWVTPSSGEKVDRTNVTQFGRAMGQLGIQMIPSYSPQARGRSERFFGTIQGRLPQELALEGITTMEAANRYLEERFWLDFNKKFMVEPKEEGDAFVPLMSTNLDDILCIQEERQVGKDNCVSYKRMKLQIPASPNRTHYIKARVRVHEYADGQLAPFHGPRCIGRYDDQGVIVVDSGEEKKEVAAA